MSAADTEIAIAIISAISLLLATISLITQYISHRPKITGRVDSLILQPDVDENGVITINLLPLLNITTKRRVPVYILKYEAEIDFGDGYEELDQYLVRPTIPTFNVECAEISIEDWRRLLIHIPYKPVQFGEPLSGFIIRYIEINDKEISGTDENEFVINFYKKIKRLRVTVTDSFNHKHKFESLLKDLIDNKLLVERLEIMGAKVSLAAAENNNS